MKKNLFFLVFIIQAFSLAPQYLEAHGKKCGNTHCRFATDGCCVKAGGHFCCGPSATVCCPNSEGAPGCCPAGYMCDKNKMCKSTSGHSHKPLPAQKR